VSDRVETADNDRASDDLGSGRLGDTGLGDTGLEGSVDGRGRAGGEGRGRAAGRDVVLVLVAYVVLGLVCGLLWWLLVDPATFTKVSDGGSMGELELGKRFNGDAWYAVIAAVAGLASGVLITWWRSRDLLLVTVLLLVGAGIAAAVMAVTGHLLGPGDPDAALAAAKAGGRVPVPLAVTAKASYLVWPIAALIGSLIVLWSPPRDTRN
jgi:Na+-driven multidrug efflux pump